MNDFLWSDMLVRKRDKIDVINTYKMIELIERHGVNTFDDNKASLGDFVGYMDEKQIEMMFDVYHFDIHLHLTHNYMFFYPFHTDNFLMLLQKCLDLDQDYKYLVYPVRSGFFTYEKTLKRSFSDALIPYKGKSLRGHVKKDYQKALEMVENHEKRGTSFFQIMLSRLNITN